MEWYDWRNVRESLVIFGRAIQGVSPYTVVIEPDEKTCATGYCNFSRRRIAVMPSMEREWGRSMLAILCFASSL